MARTLTDQSGQNNGMYGKHHTLEHRLKMSILLKGTRLGKEASSWKGDNVKYAGLHAYLRKYIPRPDLCEICHLRKAYELANKNGQYNRDFVNWQWLCRSCHIKIENRIKKIWNRRTKEERSRIAKKGWISRKLKVKQN
jgi:hypothetical protein